MSTVRTIVITTFAATLTVLALTGVAHATQASTLPTTNVVSPAPLKAAVVSGILASPIVRAGRSVRFSGNVIGRHGDGTHVVTLEVRVLNHGRWPLKSSVWVDGSYSRGATRFAKAVEIPSRGRWRVTAVHPADADSAAGSSRPVAVRAVGAKVIALTYDDGPRPGNTDAVLAALSAYDARATFFMLGSMAKAYPGTAAKVRRAGHAIGDHSYSHAVLPRKSAPGISREITEAAKWIRRATGVEPVWFRPPYGSTSSTVRAVASRLGFRHILWDLDTNDWRGRGASATSSYVLGHAYSGAVVLMHDGPAQRIGTAAATRTICRELGRRGYDFVTLDELHLLGLR